MFTVLGGEKSLPQSCPNVSQSSPIVPKVVQIVPKRIRIVPKRTRKSVPGDSQPPEMEPFIRQFAFCFRIPQQLPGGWEFERGRPISESQTQLIYRFRDQSLSVFVSPVGGGDLEFRAVDIGGRKMIAGRRGGLAIAFEGGQADMKIWNAIARELTAKEYSPRRTQGTQR